MSKFYLYARLDRDPRLAYTQAMGRDIPPEQCFVDEDGETTQLEDLQEIIQPGDILIVGTITDFMLPDIDDMLNTLENFSEIGVKISSRLEPGYDISLYRSAIRLASYIYRIKNGLPPI